MPSVEVVVVHYKRPDNIPDIIHALRAQTANPRITLIDAHPSREFVLKPGSPKADRTIELSHNFGGFNRYVPLGAYQCDYTLFLDDDLVPAPRCVEHFLECAKMRPGFGVMGQIGRVFPSGQINQTDTLRDNNFHKVDAVVRAYFVETCRLVSLSRMVWKLKPMMGGETTINHDDLLLCAALRLSGRDVLVTPDITPDAQVNSRELPAPYALCKRPEHSSERQEFLNQVQSIGWRSVAASSGAWNGRVYPSSLLQTYVAGIAKE